MTSEPHPTSPFPVGNSGASASMTFDARSGPLIVGGLTSTDGSSRASVTWARERLNAGAYEPCVSGDDCVGHWSAAGQLNYARAWPTTTSLVSGRLLVAGGLSGTNVPLNKAEQGSPALRSSAVPGLYRVPGDGHAASLLSDGRVLLTGGAQSQTAHAWSSTDPDDQAVADVGRILNQRRGHQSFLLRSGEVLLAGGESTPGDANEELFNPSTGESRDLGVRLTARRSGLALDRDRFLFAGEDSLELVDVSSGADVRVETIELWQPVGCATPGLARLLNGRVAVVGQRAVFELDPKQPSLSFSPVALGTPRCDAALTALPDGTLAIVGGNPSNDPDADRAIEIYHPATSALDAKPLLGRVSRGRPTENGVFGARAIVRFSGLLLVGQDSQTLVNWSRSADTNADADTETVLALGSLSASPHQSVTALADGGILRAWRAPDSGGTPMSSPRFHYEAARIETMRTDPTDIELDGAPQTVLPGQEVALTGLKLSRTWPENSGGTTHGSATNAPVAVWIPMLDGWPVTGTFTKWSEGSATWRVPHPAFPGLGVLGYVRSGTFHPLRLVRIGELANSGTCVENTECESGFCADGVCCATACENACQACTAALKGEGADGVCGAIPDKSEDLACSDGNECRQGDCQPNRECKTRADCAEGSECNSKRQCEVPVNEPQTSIGCSPGCRIASRQSATSELWGLGLAVSVSLLRRRARRAAL